MGLKLDPYLHIYRTDKQSGWTSVDASEPIQGILDDPGDMELDLFVVGRDIEYVVTIVEGGVIQQAMVFGKHSSEDGVIALKCLHRTRRKPG